MRDKQRTTDPTVRAVALAAALVLAVSLLAGGARADLAAIVESMPDCDKNGKYTGPATDVAAKAVLGVLEGGKDNILALVGMLKEPGKGEDYKAHYLLHAVATHARRPGAEPQRRMVCDALATALDGAKPSIIKAYILEELKWIGGKESVGPISKLLLDEKLYDFAVQALVASKAAAPLREALPRAKGRTRVALIQALGVLRDSGSVAALIEAASDPATRLGAVEALAAIGDPRAVGPVLKVARLAKASYEEMKTAEAALRLAQRLAAAGKKDDAERIYTTLAEQCPGPAGRHIRIGCFRGLAAIAGDEVIGELLKALADPDVQVRAAAAETARSLPGGLMVDKWLDLLKKGNRKDRPGVLFVLGALGDAKALSAVLGALDDKEDAVRREALRAAGGIGGKDAAEALVARAMAKKGVEGRVAFESLIACRGRAANKVVGAAAKDAPDPATKARLIDVLTARRASDQMAVIVAAAADADASVRLAAARALSAFGGGREAPVLAKMLKAAKDDAERKTAEDALLALGPRSRRETADAVIAALDGAGATEACAMLRVLGRVGGAKAAQALTAQADSPDAKVRDEAVRVLSKWREGDGTAEAHAGLLKIAQGTKDPKHRALALRQYASLARRRWRRDPPKQAQACGEALKIARRPEDKRYVLGVLGEIHHVDSVKLAASHLSDKDLIEEAGAAVVRIAGRLGHKADPDIQAALRQVVEVSKNKRTVAEAKRFLVKKP